MRDLELLRWPGVTICRAIAAGRDDLRYWVVGGEYTDTSFRTLAPGKREERRGPFETYNDAFAVWSAQARATVDDATIRYRIVAEDEASAA
jgi:hypothetical protein